MNLLSEEYIIYHVSPEGIKHEFIIIRGWGGLTGVGGMTLEPEIAIQMQNDFAQFIIDKLKS